MSYGYRKDIDGLRGIAVASVLLFHAGFKFASGGFIGVDVFFVISGYLITRNISTEMSERKFSFLQFYIKRIRRLLPALFFTFLLALVLGYALFSPGDFQRLGNSLLYSILSLSNFFFWGEAGYFNANSNIKPLLHTWSLSVEEQFYLIWPLMMSILFLFKKRYLMLWFSILTIIASLVISVIFMDKNPEAVFYLLPFRFFEFLLGAVLVFTNISTPKKFFLNEFIVLIGLGFVLYPVLTFSNDTVFPGLGALLPCLGSCFIIFAGGSKSRAASFFLRQKLLVEIGLRSYSVYLIHWPLFVFYRYWKLDSISNLETIILLIISLLLGSLMWKYIERPFRYNKNTKSSDLFLLVLFLTGLMLSFASAHIWAHKGFPSRFPKEYFMSEEELYLNRDRYWKNVSKLTDIKILKGKNNHKNIIIMGNSHAIDLIYSLRENGSEINITFLPTTHLCYNFGTPLSSKHKQLCSKKLSENMSKIALLNADAVYLHDNWPRLDLENLKDRLVEIRKITKAPIYVFGPKMMYKRPIP